MTEGGLPLKTYQPITEEIIHQLKTIVGANYVKTDKDLLVDSSSSWNDLIKSSS